MDNIINNTSTSSARSWDNTLEMSMQQQQQQQQQGNHHHHHHHHQHLAFDHHNPLDLVQLIDAPFHAHIQSPNFNPSPAQQSQAVFEGENSQNDEHEEESLGAMKEMMYKIAAMQPVDIDPATIKKPKRRNVRISDDPQTVAARHRRERISERIRILQRLVPGGTKMDTASMLDEAIRYVKFLKRQVQELQASPQPPMALHTTALGPVEWPPRADGSSSSSSAAVGAPHHPPPGLGFGFN